MTVLEKKLKIIREFFNNNSGLFFVLTILLGLNLINGCEYKYYVEPKIVVDPTVVISFKNDIGPIFDAHCISCHKTGGQSPDLTSTNGYLSLTTGSKKFIDTPSDSSLLIQRITKTGSLGKKKQFMPPSGKLSEDKISLILNWIKQGAKDN